MNRNVRALCLILAGAASACAQFSSGSTGTDGALNYTTAGTYVFDPTALGLNPAGDNVFNFTTINIGAGVTLKLTNSRLRGKPVYFLATGDVTIAGTLDLSGAQGTDMLGSNPWNTRTTAQPGPGGYSGGLGAVNFGGASASATVGFGPGSSTYPGSAASFATAGGSGSTVGPTYGNATLNPLLGGSGGTGGTVPNVAGGNGGAGGGALRIVSATSIQVSGSILAKGGGGGYCDNGVNPTSFAGSTRHGGGGSGGSIHLIAPSISGAGTIDASGGSRNYTFTGGLGRVLLSGNTVSFSGTLNAFSNTGRLNLPTAIAAPTVTITSVNGVSAPSNPTADVTIPDITITASSAVTVNLSASNVPLGTQVQLTLTPETGNQASATCNPLAGTIASSTATCSITFPTGVNITSARATW